MKNKILVIDKKVKYSEAGMGSSCCDATVCLANGVRSNSRKAAFDDRGEGLYVEKNKN